MRTVKSVSDLKQLALTKGASVQLGDSRFNSTSDRLQPTPKKAPEAKAAEVSAVASPKEPATVNVDLSPVADAIDRGQQLMAGVMHSITQSLAALQPEEQVSEWEFVVNRNADGTLSSIKAKAIK